MSSIKIVTDSTADIPSDIARELGIEVVPVLIHVDGEVYRAGEEITTEDFYFYLQEGNHTFGTSSPPPSVFEHLYRRLTVEYEHVFSIHLSNRLGGIFRSATQACAKLPASLTRIELIDSKSASMGMGMVVQAAARAVQSGAKPNEVRQLINAMMRHTHAVFFVDNIESLETSGRITLAASVLSSMQRIKPLLLIDDGDIVPYERTRTRAKAIEGLFTFIEDFPHVQEVTVLYSTTPEDVERLLEKVDPVFPRDQVRIIQFGPAIAVHLGAGAMGVVVFEGIEEPKTKRAGALPG